MRRSSVRSSTLIKPYRFVGESPRLENAPLAIVEDGQCFSSLSASTFS
jgi:hypothetical protein